MRHTTRDEHLFSAGPKRILALDGGGIRGVLTLGYLERIEAILRARAGGDPDFRLCDYFDLIGGTSTGSIIATALALGFSVQKVRALYLELAAEVFKRPFWRFGLFLAKFPEQPLIAALEREFGQRTLGSEDLRTGLMIISKRMDTGSPWVIHNNPRGQYFDPPADSGKAIPNRRFLLSQIVRASTAAPHYFEPERIHVGTDIDGVYLEGAFIDGGVTPHNNPALQMLLLATLDGFRFKWPLGEDNLLLVSAGTGYGETRMVVDDVIGMPAASLSMRALLSVMDDCNWLNQTLLQWMSRSPTRWFIDREIREGLGPGGLLTYLRYNIHLSAKWLQTTLGIDIAEEMAVALQVMDNPANVSELDALGRRVAAQQVLESHFPTHFDLPRENRFLVDGHPAEDTR